MATNVNEDNNIIEILTADGDVITFRNGGDEGFNPITFQDDLIEKSEKANRDFHNDIVNIIQLYCTKGGRINNIKTTDPQLRENIDQWIKIYNIKDKIEKRKDPKTVTLSRIASSFPWITVKIHSQGKIDRPVCMDIPEGMKCLQVLPFYEAIPDKDRAHYINATQYYLVLESMATNRNHKNKRFCEVLQIMHPCMMGSRLGDLGVSIIEKLEFLQEFKIYPADSADKVKIEEASALFLEKSTSY